MSRNLREGLEVLGTFGGLREDLEKIIYKSIVLGENLYVGKNFVCIREGL